MLPSWWTLNSTTKYGWNSQELAFVCGILPRVEGFIKSHTMFQTMLISLSTLKSAPNLYHNIYIDVCNTTWQDYAGHAGWNGIPGSLKDKTKYSLSKSRYHPELHSIQPTQAHQRHWVSLCLFMGHIYRTSYLVYVSSMNNKILLNYLCVGWGYKYCTVQKLVLFMTSTNIASHEHDVYVYVLLMMVHCILYYISMAFVTYLTFISEAGYAITIKSSDCLKGKLGTVLPAVYNSVCS